MGGGGKEVRVVGDMETLESLALLVLVENGRCNVVPVKIKNGLSIRSRDFISGYVFKRKKFKSPEELLVHHAHSSITHSSPKVEVTHMSGDCQQISLSDG